MGVILNGILGAFSGKIGPTVGATWKGIPYARSYAIPSNPRTSLQVAHRAKFKQAVFIARNLLLHYIVPNLNANAVKMSGFNVAVKNILPLVPAEDPRLGSGDILFSTDIPEPSNLQVEVTINPTTFKVDYVAPANEADYPAGSKLHILAFAYGFPQVCHKEVNLPSGVAGTLTSPPMGTIWQDPILTPNKYVQVLSWVTIDTGTEHQYSGITCDKN